MPAELESGFFGSTATGERWAAWHNLGTTIDRPVVDTEEAIKIAGLDWEVLPTPIYADLADGRRATNSNLLAQVRSDTGKILGVVSERYETIQNTERFAFMDSLLDSDAAKWHTAGVLREGRQVWMLAKLDLDVRIAGLEEELTNMYLLLSDGTEGLSALKVAVTPVRVVCMNTLRIALDSSPRQWTARHTASLRDKMDLANQTLKLSRAYAQRFEEVGTQLVNTKMTPASFKAFLGQLVPLTAGAVATDRSWKNTMEKRDAIDSIYRTSDDLANLRGTAWGALQAVGEWSDWARTSRNSESAWLRRVGENAAVKDAAYQLLAG